MGARNGFATCTNADFVLVGVGAIWKVHRDLRPARGTPRPGVGPSSGAGCAGWRVSYPSRPAPLRGGVFRGHALGWCAARGVAVGVWCLVRLLHERWQSVSGGECDRSRRDGLELDRVSRPSRASHRRRAGRVNPGDDRSRSSSRMVQRRRSSTSCSRVQPAAAALLAEARRADEQAWCARTRSRLSCRLRLAAPPGPGGRGDVRSTARPAHPQWLAGSPALRSHPAGRTPVPSRTHCGRAGRDDVRPAGSGDRSTQGGTGWGGMQQATRVTSGADVTGAHGSRANLTRSSSSRLHNRSTSSL